MATYYSVDAFARAQSKRMRRFATAMVVEHDDMVEDIKREAIRLVSGKVKTRTLREMGHPFARRRILRSKVSGRRRGSAPSLPINEQTGRLRRSLRVVRRNAVTGKFSVSGRKDLFFNAPYAKAVLSRKGTKTMVSRGYWRALESYARRRSFAAIKRVRSA